MDTLADVTDRLLWLFFRYNESVIVTSQLMDVYMRMVFMAHQTGIDLELSLQRLLMWSSYYSNVPKDHRSALGVQFNDIVAECRYKGKTCTKANFRTYLHPSLINCYTFQADLTNTTAKILDGPQNGLTLILKSSPNINFNYNNLDSMQNVESIRLAIHAPGTVPFMTKQALNLEPGKLTSISLTMKKFERLGSPYTKCKKDEVFKLESRAFRVTRDACREKCIGREIERRCNCTSTMLEDLTTTPKPYCLSINNVSISEFRARTECEVSLALGENDINCNECFWDCKEYDYGKQITFLEWPGQGKVDQFITHYVYYKYHNLKPLKRPCSDPILSYYNFLLKKANISNTTCSENPKCTKGQCKRPFSLMTISNRLVQHGLDIVEMVNNLLDDPDFPDMYEYVMDVPFSYYNIKTLAELKAKWVKESFYHVNIYFHQTSVEQHIQEPSFSFPDLCSSIGGILGLWAGFSVMTIIEVGLFLIKSISNCSCKKSKIDSMA